MSSNLLGELAANNGTYYLSNGFDYLGKVDQIIVRGSNMQITNLEIFRNGVYVDVKAEYLSSDIVPNGLRITPKNDEVFNKISVNTLGGFGGLELVLSA